MKLRFLNAFSVLRSCDLDHARAAVAGHYCDHDLVLTRGTSVEVTHNRVRGDKLSVNLLRYGGDVRIDPGELRDFYLFQLPLAGAAQVQHRNHQVDSSPRVGSILNPDRPTTMEWSATCTQLMLQVDADYLNHVAADVYGGALPGPVRFDPHMDLTSPTGRKIKALIIGLARSFETGRFTPGRKVLGLLHSEWQLVQEILLHQPSNVQHLLAAPIAPASSVQLRKAIAFMRTHVDVPLTLGQIAQAAGTHPRGLQNRFRQELGRSPMAFLRDLRLDMARYWLLQRVEPHSVTDVAYSCGYSHLGRFSGEYRTRFGHSPSQSALTRGEA